LPKEYREALSLDIGDGVSISIAGEVIVIKKEEQDCEEK